MSAQAQFIGKPVRRDSLPEWAREQLPPEGAAKRIRDPDRLRGLTVMEAVEKGYVTKKTPTLLYQWSKRPEEEGGVDVCPVVGNRCRPGLPGLEGEILDRWHEYQVTAQGQILRFMVFSADQLKRSKDAKTAQADALRRTRGVTDRAFMEQYPDLFRREDGSLPKRRPTIMFYWRDKDHGCDYLPNGRPMNFWKEGGRIVNDPVDVKRIVRRARRTDIKKWTDKQTGETHTPIPLAEFMRLSGLVEQELAAYRDRRPHPALGRKIAFIKGKRPGGRRTRLGYGYLYPREDAVKIGSWYEAKANGKVGKVAMAAAFLQNLVTAAPVTAGDGIRAVRDAGFSSTFRKAFEPAGLLSTRVGEEYYWHHKDTAPPSDASKRQRAIRFLKKLLSNGTVVKASDGMRVFCQAGFAPSAFYLVRRDAGVQLTFLGTPGREGLHVWHLEGTDPKCEPKGPDAIAALLSELGPARGSCAEPDSPCVPSARTQPAEATPNEAGAVSGEAKYPGHVKKPYRTGRKPDPEREVVLEFVYELYKSKSRQEVRQAAIEQFGPKHAPADDEAVKWMAKEWANRFEPPLPWGKG